ncbi:MAG: class I SAM-dependent methyltransferase [Bacteroidales bacterium]|nr:class I SAM-dependent methyltransferase [Bacteroidales bacterium]
MILIQTPPVGWKDYELLDSGNFLKLERFGSFIMSRPEPKAIWQPALSPQEWERLSHVRFIPGAGFSKAGKEDSGSWEYLKKMPQRWTIDYNNIRLRLALTSFKHVGVFPEQCANWDFIYEQTLRLKEKLGRAPKILNLFAYTGAASLAAKAAGADVTHLDSVRQVVSWANENMELSALSDIRWIVEDASKFVSRQVRRGAQWDGIILDPPDYGRGPSGEKWHLVDNLWDILNGCNAILSPKDSFLILNLYSNGYSAVLCETFVRTAFGPQGSTESGELVLTDKAGRRLPLSVFTRLVR